MHPSGGCGPSANLGAPTKWAYSKMALRGIRIAEVRVRLPVGPPNYANGKIAPACAGRKKYCLS